MATLAAQDGHAFWTNAGRSQARAVFAAEGIRCAGCSRSIERSLNAVDGVQKVNVNVATSRVCVDWDPRLTDLPHILRAVSNAGFKPVPLGGNAADTAFRDERRKALKRIGLAGLGMMQVMMYVFGVYVARPDAIDPAIASYLRYVAMLITTPVLLYSGAPFFAGAWHDLRRRALGMDVPVAIALVLAYGASVFNTVRGSGQTYFDSVTMFIFFLGAGRYVEMIVRQRSLSLSEALGRSLPAHAMRVRSDGTTERIPVQDIRAGDALSVAKGAVIPVDAELAAGQALVDESLVTGESRPERKVAGAVLLGGAVNAGDPIRIVARRNVSDSTLASIVGLLERAQGSRPAIARAADHVAAFFVGAVLLLAVAVAATWIFFDPSRAFPAALAVLVVTCPCALSLATPVAVAAASTRLAKSGLLVTRADALERLAGVDTVVLDKTGTLTSGTPAVSRVTLLGTFDERAVLSMAAALERESGHPIAAAFAMHADAGVIASDLREFEGQGIAGNIAGNSWRLGRHDFVAEIAASVPTECDHEGVFLGNAQGLAAVFGIGEELRPGAASTIATLRELRVEPVIASGDRRDAVDPVATDLGIERASSRLAPEQKVSLVRQLQAGGRHVLAIGDGVNDGPLLAASNVSCAMGQGSAIAQAAADFLLLNDSLTAVADGISTARRMLTIVRQNLRWSVIYNLAAVPVAALDLVPPWLAAIGMSVSSLVVVLNASRLAAVRELR
jgi:Cu2+-exporting ATPase